MRTQRSDAIDFYVGRERHIARIAQRLPTQTRLLRARIPRVPRYGCAAAALVEFEEEAAFSSPIPSSMSGISRSSRLRSRRGTRVSVVPMRCAGRRS